MAHRFNREELYNLVWAEPMKTLAARYGVSGTDIARECRSFKVPTPERGHWSKLSAGKTIRRPTLPARGLGMADEVVLGRGSRWSSYQALSDREILEAETSAPVFHQDIDEVADLVRAKVGHVPVPRGNKRTHPLIVKFLAKDEKLRLKATTRHFLMPHQKPRFDSPFGRRRIRLMNAIFLALERQGVAVSTFSSDDSELSAIVNHQMIDFSVDDSNAESYLGRRQSSQISNPTGRMKIAIGSYRSNHDTGYSWEDRNGEPVEKHLTEIATELLVTAERKHRHTAQLRHEWIVLRQFEIKQDRRRKKLASARKKHEHRIQMRKQRIEHLMLDAAALRQARNIRSYVSDVSALLEQGIDGVRQSDFKAWKAWALAEADRIDPVVSRRFLSAFKNNAD